MRPFDEVIAAIATPPGEGGISVIRVSGKGSLEIVDRGFRGQVCLAESRTHRAHFGQFVDKEGEAIDEVIATVFRAPHSYTAEDVVEISCHGGYYVTRKILESVIALGARHSLPGEFTKRAFLNGRIDLSQAEAVADLIKARSELARRNSLLQLEGSLSARIGEILNRLVGLCSLVELELDFIEEGITFTTVESLRGEVQTIVTELQPLVDSYEYGRFCREGAKVVLVGRPNVGKSSLLNSLLDQNRAIVTEIPGTTRDVIEESILLNGMLFRVVDTAGIRETEDVIEKEGLRRTKEQIKQADVCLYILDATSQDTAHDITFINEVRDLRNGNLPSEILVPNKMDLIGPTGASPQYAMEPLSAMLKYPVSAITKQGIDKLEKGLVDICSKRSEMISETGVTITNERHKSELERAINRLNLVIESIEQSQSGEIIAVDIRGAIDALGAIIGKVTTDDILNNIFSKFCIGK